MPNQQQQQQQQMLTAQQQQGGQPQFYSGDVYPQQAGTSNAPQPHILHMVNAQGQPIGQQVKIRTFRQFLDVLSFFT